MWFGDMTALEEGWLVGLGINPEVCKAQGAAQEVREPAATPSAEQLPPGCLPPDLSLQLQVPCEGCPPAANRIRGDASLAGA